MVISMLKKKDIISINDLSKEEILYILKTAEEMTTKDCSQLCKGKILATLFFEPSTRTRLSFETSMKRMGGSVIGFTGEESTSRTKGESLYDTIKIVEGYADIIVMRHKVDGSARLAAEASKVPVINGGDGSNQHPTQMLLDLYTIKQSQGRLENLKIAMVGDLKYGRTVHSLAVAMAMFNAEMYFVAPEQLQMPNYILEDLQKNNITYHLVDNMQEIIEKVDILYMTRIQKERFPDLQEYEKVKNVFILSKKLLETAKPNMKILHPLPRVNEISEEVDIEPHAYYFNQAHYGIPVRMAIIALLLGCVK